MKKNKLFPCFSIIALLLTFLNPATASDLGARIKLQDANAVSSKANNASSLHSDFMNDPFLQSEVNGFGNMIQQMTGNVSNINMAQELQKQQGEYARQKLQSQQDE